MDARRRSLVALLVGAALAGAVGDALAQRRGYLTPEERERLREDLNAARRDLYRNRGPQQPPQQQSPWQQPGSAWQQPRTIRASNSNASVWRAVTAPKAHR